MPIKIKKTTKPPAKGDKIVDVSKNTPLEKKKRGRPKKITEEIVKIPDRIEIIQQSVKGHEKEFWDKMEEKPRVNINEDRLEQKTKELEEINETLEEVTKTFKKEYTDFTAHAVLNTLWFDPEGREIMENEIKDLQITKSDLEKEIADIKKENNL
ncbi:MAG: hypothetical protein WCO84_04470 [bacterium]